MALGLAAALPGNAAQRAIAAAPTLTSAHLAPEQNPAIPSPAIPAAERSLLAQRLSFPLQGIRPSRQRVGGFVRGGSIQPTCIPRDASPSLTAIAPVRTDADPDSVRDADIEWTVSDRPTFFAYIPTTTATQAEFAIAEVGSEQLLYETPIPLTGRPGIVGVTLPPNVRLDVGKVYFWSLVLVCDPDDFSGNAGVEGYIQRQPLPTDLAQRLDQTSVRDRPALYATQGIWQDTLTTLAKLRYANPNDPSLNADWRSLLNSVNLTVLSNAPIVQLVDTSVEPPASAQPSSTAPLFRPPAIPLPSRPQGATPSNRIP